MCFRPHTVCTLLNFHDIMTNPSFSKLCYNSLSQHNFFRWLSFLWLFNWKKAILVILDLLILSKITVIFTNDVFFFRRTFCMTAYCLQSNTKEQFELFLFLNRPILLFRLLLMKYGCCHRGAPLDHTRVRGVQDLTFVNQVWEKDAACLWPTKGTFFAVTL